MKKFSGEKAIGLETGKGRLVLIEPDENVREALTTLLRCEGWNVGIGGDCGDISRLHEQDTVDAVISESVLSGCAAKDVLETCAARNIPVIFTGRELAVQEAVDLIRQGAADYLEKPFPQRRLLDLLNHISHRHNS